jgi:hypothetical protein
MDAPSSAPDSPERTGPGNRSRSRPTWDELPAAVRAGTETMLGARVVASRSVRLGLTPGVASKLSLDDGRQVFVKAAGVARGREGVRKLRQEAWILAGLPPEVPAAGLLGVYDDGRWAAVVSTHVEGRPPALPWRRTELDRVLAAVTRFARATTPSPLPAPRFVKDWAADLTGWGQLAASPNVPLPAAVDPWADRHRERLAALEAGWPAAAAGQTLLHGDLRADNILLTGDGVWFVDWPSACVGAAWLDLVFLLPSVAASAGIDPEEVVAGHPLTRNVDPAALTAMVAAVAGFLITVGMEPLPWHAPEVRAFQLAEGAAAVTWLRRRLGE